MPKPAKHADLAVPAFPGASLAGVAAAVAGVVGIVLAVAVMRTPMVLTMFGALQDVPPFPVRAAITGLIASVVIGALAGFLPALVAVRSRVIDTLRV